MTADQRDRIGTLLAIGTVIADAVEASGTEWAMERARRWRQARAEWDEVQGQVQCHSRDCDNQADSGGVLCTECWADMGPYDRELLKREKSSDAD